MFLINGRMVWGANNYSNFVFLRELRGKEAYHVKLLLKVTF